MGCIGPRKKRLEPGDQYSSAREKAQFAANAANTCEALTKEAERLGLGELAHLLGVVALVAGDAFATWEDAPRATAGNPKPLQRYSKTAKL